MKKISTWTLIGYLAGAVFGIGSFIRYYIIFPDLDKALTDILIGVIVCAIAWLYNKQKQHEYSIDAVEEYLDDKKIESGGRVMQGVG